MKLRAFTFLELILVIACSLILTMFAFPAMRDLFEKNQAENIAALLVTSLQYARSEAISRGTKVIFCKSRDNITCSGDWDDGQIIITANNLLLQALPHISPPGKLVWQSSLGENNAITFIPTGTTDGQRGSFFFCPKAHSSHNIAVILQYSGRVRISNQTAEGKNINCDTSV